MDVLRQVAVTALGFAFLVVVPGAGVVAAAALVVKWLRSRGR